MNYYITNKSQPFIIDMCAHTKKLAMELYWVHSLDEWRLRARKRIMFRVVLACAQAHHPNDYYSRAGIIYIFRYS